MASSARKIARASSYSDRHTTYLKKEVYAYSWKIRSFSEWLAEIGTQSQLSLIFPQEPATYKWKLDFRPEYKDGDITYCGVYLKLCVAPKAVNVKFEITMLDDKEKQIRNCPGSVLFDLISSPSWGWNKFVVRQTLLQNLKSDVLVISCKVEVTSEVVNEGKTVNPAMEVGGNKLSNDLATLLAGEKFGDATITVGTENFLVCKAILTARSPTFADMFERNMVGNKQNNVKIVDIEPDVFEKLLLYIYTDKIDDLNAFAYQLFAAADKYRILPLKTLCQQSILANLSVQNAAKTLILADEHHAVEMKRRALQFLSSEASRGVTGTAGWKSMVRTHPQLVSEAFEAKGSTANAAAP